MRAPLFAFALAATLITTPLVAHAEKPATAGSAATLFYEARDLMARGQFAAACERFEKSLKLDRGVGTEFNLADCNERVGKIATAWTGFQHVATVTKARGQADRERVARARAKALEPKLPWIVIEVPTPEPSLEVRLDGRVIEPDQWGVGLPVDPGMRELVVSAPDRPTFRLSVGATRGVIARVRVPKLGGVVEATGPVAAFDAETPAVSTTTLTFGEVPRALPERGLSQRTVGYAVGGAGLVGLGVAGFFGFHSLTKHDRAKAHCNGDLCDAEGVALREDAIRSGRDATIATAVGGVALATGIVLLLTAPSDERPLPAPPSKVSLSPAVSVGGGSLSLQGVWP